MLQGGAGVGISDRLTVGVAARLSRYLQVLTQAQKMGKERISSQEIADYTNINATQIRRDLSNFGKFGKRGVGYSIDSLLSEIRKILRTQGQHNIALVGAGRLGQAIASSPIFAEHGINIAAVFDKDPDKVGRRVGNASGPRRIHEHRQRREREAPRVVAHERADDRRGQVQAAPDGLGEDDVRAGCAQPVGRRDQMREAAAEAAAGHLAGRHAGRFRKRGVHEAATLIVGDDGGAETA